MKQIVKADEQKALVEKQQHLPADISAVEAALVQGDLSKLNTDQRVIYYNKVCESVGLNSMTKPFDYVTYNGKLILYARKDATEQLRKIHKVSINLSDFKLVGDILTIIASGSDAGGRNDSATGAVNIKGLYGDQLANAYMKCETKAKRRLTLSICGLGMLDESEIENNSDPKDVTQRPALTTSETAVEPVSAELAQDPPAIDENQSFPEDEKKSEEKKVVEKTPDESGFVVPDDSKPFIKQKVAPSAMERVAGEIIIECWPKHKSKKISDIKKDDEEGLFNMLNSIEVQSQTKNVPEDWKLFYSNACVYLGRKMSLNDINKK